jgi:hypothetical protein
VRKLDGSYWLVQALRTINQIVHRRQPVVPKHYTLLTRIPPDYQWGSVVDLKHAFWAYTLIADNREIIAFEWEDHKTNRKQQYRWIILPKGFTVSPKLLGQILE